MLPNNNAVLSVIICASSSIGKPLPAAKLKTVLDDANTMQQLLDKKAIILSYVESQMKGVAPNLSELLGFSVAAKLLAAAGSLEMLIKTPASHI